MMNKIIQIFIVAFTFIGCINNTITEPTVTVSVEPQKFFVNQIAGKWLNVNVMVPSGVSPVTYEPTPMQMKAFSSSLAYFRIGHIPFEIAWMPKLSSLNPSMKIVDTSKGLSLISEEEFEEAHANTVDGRHSHSHAGFNPHIWLSPDLVKKQSQIIYNTLVELFPDSARQMQVNLISFHKQVDSVHLILKEQLGLASNKSFIVYHPVWDYLARDYNLNQIAIEYNGKESTANKMKKIIDFANDNNIRTIFVQREFSSAQAKSVATEINGEVIVLNPLAYNWFDIMDQFGKAFKKM